MLIYIYIKIDMCNQIKTTFLVYSDVWRLVCEPLRRPGA